MVLGNELFEEKALSFNHWEKEQCPHFTAAGWAGEAPGLWAILEWGPSEKWLGSGLNPSLGNSTHCNWVAGGVASPSLRLCASPETGKLPILPQDVLLWVKPSRWTPLNNKCNYSPRLDKTLKASSEQAPLHHLQELRGVNNRAACREPNTRCTVPNLWDIFQNQLRWDTAGKNHY